LAAVDQRDPERGAHVGLLLLRARDSRKPERDAQLPDRSIQVPEFPQQCADDLMGDRCGGRRGLPSQDCPRPDHCLTRPGGCQQRQV
jgi:hypothetical protein